MKYAIIVFFGICALGGFGFALYFALTPHITKVEKQPSPTPVFPEKEPVVSVPSDITMPVSAKSGGAVAVHDFRNPQESEQVVLDTHGEFYILKDAEKDPGYSIAYFPSEQTFNITLTREPYLETQKVAESVLLRRLRLSVADLCRLNVAVVSMQKGREVAQSSELVTCKAI